MYSLRNKNSKKLIRFDVNSNEGAESCNSTSVMIGELGEYLWIVDSREVVEKAKLEPTPWYNSSVVTPDWELGFKPDDWDIVELGIL